MYEHCLTLWDQCVKMKKTIVLLKSKTLERKRIFGNVALFVIP